MMAESSVIKYQGRQARRKGSEQRRIAILEGALQIIIESGVRSVRHRAVAKAADVPLSATTYYFKDIEDLISDAFVLFAEQAMEEVIDPFRDQAFALIEQFHKDSDRQAAVKNLARLTANYLVSEVLHAREHLIAEQAFFHEAVRNEKLRELANHYVSRQEDVIAEAFAALGSDQPESDANSWLATLFWMEQRLMLLTVDEVRVDTVEQQLLRILNQLFPV